MERPCAGCTKSCEAGPVRFFHFPLRTHRVRLRAVAAAGGKSAPLPRPHQLVLVRDEDVAAPRVDNAYAGRRKAPERRRDCIDLSRW